MTRDNDLIQQKLDNLDRLRDAGRELQTDLEKSLALEKLWPEVFEHGAARSTTVGNPDYGYTFKLMADNGEERTFDLLDVPELLWPAGVREIKRTRRINRRKQ